MGRTFSKRLMMEIFFLRVSTFGAVAVSTLWIQVAARPFTMLVPRAPRKCLLSSCRAEHAWISQTQQAARLCIGLAGTAMWEQHERYLRPEQTQIDRMHWVRHHCTQQRVRIA